MLTVLFELIQQQHTTTVSIDWGTIATAAFPTIAIIVAWYLQRKTTKDAATALAVTHEMDKQAAIARQEQAKEAVLAGQDSIKDAVNTQLMILVNARVKTLKDKIVAAGGTVNGAMATLENASDLINDLENQLERLTAKKE